MTDSPAQRRVKKKRFKLLLKLSRDMIRMGQIVMPEMFRKKSPKMHFEIAKLLMDPTERKVNIIAPRGFAKSTIVAGLYVIWHVFFEDIFLSRKRRPKYVVLSSKTQKHAKKLLGTIKAIVELNRFKKLFGEWGESTSKTWTQDTVKLKDGTLIEAIGTGQQARGMKNVFQRPTLIILDDPEDENNTKTAEAMDSNFNWLLQALEQAVDADTGKIIVIGTPLHQRCMVFRLKHRKDYTTLHYQGIVNGKSAWPEEKSTEALMRLRESLAAIGKVSVWYQEIQCQIRLDEEATFREQDINYYEGYLEQKGRNAFMVITAQGTPVDGRCPKLDKPIIKPVTVQMGVDPASTTTRRSDYFAIVPLAITRDEEIYVLPYFRRRVDPYDGAQHVISYYKQYRPRIIRVETVGFQTMLKSYLMRSREVDVRLPIIEEKPPGNQSKLGEGGRIEELQHYFRRGNVYMQPSMTEMVQEFLLYPKPDHDDLMDGFWYAGHKLIRPAHAAEDYSIKKRKVAPKIEGALLS